jgi:hypothetical protein
MNLTFTKGSGKYDVLEVRRASGSPERIDCPKQGIIPHEMAHYAVEHTLQARGFITRLKDGEAAAFRMQPDGEGDSVERLVEVIQGDAWSGGTSTATDIIDMYRVTCLARECAPLLLDEESVCSIRNALEDLSKRWQAVPVGGSLQLAL